MHLIPELKRLIGHDQFAYNFCMSYMLFCHAVDDIVDDKKVEPEHVLKTWDLATVVFSNPFYIKYSNVLSPLIRASCNMYADSVKYEKETDWRKTCADTLRHSGNMVVAAAVELVAGYEAKREISDILNICSYEAHKGDIICQS